MAAITANIEAVLRQLCMRLNEIADCEGDSRVSRIDGLDRIWRARDELADRAETVTRTCQPPEPRSEGLGRILPLAARNVRRGVRVQSIRTPASLEVEGHAQAVRAHINAGVEYRLNDQAPAMTILMFDRRHALLPVPCVSTRRAALFVSDVELVRPLDRLFTACWEHGSPVDLDGGPRRGPTWRQRQILALMASGLSDDAIARQLNLVDRTIRRDICDLYDALGLASRFQLGAEARRLGWI